MIVALITFRFDDEAHLERMTRAARERRQLYEDLPGLLQKLYWLDRERSELGGLYVWESRARAEEFYSGSWREKATQAFGASPGVRYLEVTDVIANRPVAVG
ncbi:MAG TPA: YdhR family protein [Thermomicrobiaceae bacterium]|nr:YdhR family protein [Thermomicrobiaceae bacterium]